MQTVTLEYENARLSDGLKRLPNIYELILSIYKKGMGNITFEGRATNISLGKNPKLRKMWFLVHNEEATTPFVEGIKREGLADKVTVEKQEI